MNDRIMISNDIPLYPVPKPMIRRTVRLGKQRTSIKMEQEFWDYFKVYAREHKLRLNVLLNIIASHTPNRTNLASTLRTFALMQATNRIAPCLDVGNNSDFFRLIENCPFPCVVLDPFKLILQVNKSFCEWINVDRTNIVGKSIDSILIIRGDGIKELWKHLDNKQIANTICSVTYISPGKCKTSQASAITIGTKGDVKGCVLMLETVKWRE